MCKNRVKAGVTQENLDYALSRRIFAEDGVDLFPDRLKHGALQQMMRGASRIR